MSLSKFTAGSSLAFLAGVGIVKIARGRQNSEDNLETIRRLEIAILAVASGQYVISFNMKPSRIQSWRYLDWLITTPLLLRTFFLLAREKGFTGSFAPALTANIAMITLGYASEFPKRFNKNKSISDANFKAITYGISTASMIIIFYYVNKWNKFLIDAGCQGSQTLANYFYFGWSSYGLIFLAEEGEIRQSTFNVLDAINKGFFSLSVDKFIRENY